MDPRRFEAALRALQAGTTRRAGLAGMLGVMLVGVGWELDAAAKGRGLERGRNERGATPRPGRRSGPVAAGPCGDGTESDNRCAKNGDCCTMYCANGACRCKPNWMKCRKGAECCTGACVGGRCDGGAKPAGLACTQNFNCRSGLICSGGVCTPSPKAKCTKRNCKGCCEGTTCRTGKTRHGCGVKGKACDVCRRTAACVEGTCGGTPVQCGSNADCPGSAPICDAGNCRAATWAPQTTFGTQGAGPGEFSNPFGVAVPADGLTALVADYGNHRIAVWTRPGTTGGDAAAWTSQTTFGTQGTGPGNFSNATGVAVSADGLTAWVADYNNNRISVWTRPGTTGADATAWTNQTTFGTEGSGPGNFLGPQDVAVSADGLTTWVADNNNNRISVWTRPGTAGGDATAWTNQTSFGTPGSGPGNFTGPSGVAVSADGLTAWVADFENNRISVWTRQGTTGGDATAWTNQTTFGTLGTGPGNFSNPAAVAVSADGLAAWVVDFGNDRISIWTRPGTAGGDVTAWTNQTTFGTQGTGPGNFAYPVGVAVSGDGLTAWVADQANQRISVWIAS